MRISGVTVNSVYSPIMGTTLKVVRTFDRGGNLARE